MRSKRLVGGLRNRIAWSKDLTVWGRSAGVTVALDATVPDSEGNTAGSYKVTTDGTQQSQSIGIGSITSSGNRGVVSFWGRSGTISRLDIGIYDATARTITANSATDVLTCVGSCKLTNGSVIQITSTGTMPSGLPSATALWVVNVDRTAGTFQVATSAGAAPINFLTNGTGTISYTYNSGFIVWRAVTLTSAWERYKIEFPCENAAAMGVNVYPNGTGYLYLDRWQYADEDSPDAPTTSGSAFADTACVDRFDGKVRFAAAALYEADGPTIMLDSLQYGRQYVTSPGGTGATAPLVSGLTGLGTGNVTLLTGVNDTAGIISLNPTGSPANAGTLTVTFNRPIPAGHGAPVVTPALQDSSGSWGNTAIARVGGLVTDGSGNFTGFVLVWANGGVSLTAGSSYQINYRVTAVN
jgi:hypothetical protein